MELKDYNIELVKIEKPGYVTGYALHPIRDCIFNGERFFGNPVVRTDETLYLPVKELEFGCVMKIEETQKAYLIKKELFFGLVCVDIWEIPYKTDEYSKEEIFRVLRSQRPTDSFECR